MTNIPKMPLKLSKKSLECFSPGSRSDVTSSPTQALRMGYSEISFRMAGCQKAREQAREGEPTTVLVRFEYLRSDSERKLLIGQFDLTYVKYYHLHSTVKRERFFAHVFSFKRSLVSCDFRKMEALKVNKFGRSYSSRT